MSTLWAMRTEELWTRSRGFCEVSGRPLDFDTFDRHHRRNKGMGGTSRPDRDAIHNLLALDPIIHNGGPLSVHGCRAWSQRRGYLVPKHADRPQDFPVWLHGEGRWVLLTPSGRYASLPFPLAPPPEVEP